MKDNRVQSQITNLSIYLYPLFTSIRARSISRSVAAALVRENYHRCARVKERMDGIRR